MTSAKVFYPLDQFPEFKKLAEQYSIILEELKKNSFWMHWGSDQYDPSGHCEFLKGDWTVCPVYFGNYNPYLMNDAGIDKKVIDEAILSMPYRFPKTVELLKSIRSLNYAAFSRLHPKSQLDPHKHNNPQSLIFHLGLIIPSETSCGITVNGITHLWKRAGEAIIFDDTFEHTAWNHSDKERVILYIDFHYDKSLISK